MFSKYHYLSGNFNKAARVFLCLVNNELAGFCAVLPFPHPKLKNVFKEHRTVVFPDYQGIGIGTKLSDMVADLYKKNGKQFISTTSNPAMIHHRCNSSKWKLTRVGRMSTGSEKGFQNKHDLATTSANRITCSFKYCGA